MSEDTAMTQRFEPAVFSAMLQLAIGEHAEMVVFDPASGDYRVFSVALEATGNGGMVLEFELHRHGPGYARRMFRVLSLTLGAPGADGKCGLEAMACDSGLRVTEVSHWLPVLGQMVVLLKQRQRPHDALLLPLLSPAAQALWTQPLTQGVVA